jgi:3-hydroxyacyl-[acyl-carrier-protein] dehydratase
LARVPQQEPFRFIDEILEIDEEHIVARYTYPPESDFYRGHFPGHPVTPGVILIETMAQAGVVAQGIFKLCLESDEADLDKILTVFTDVNVDFTGAVRPGDRVTITGNVVFWRRRKLRAKIEMKLDDGTVVCAGELSGMGVLQ